VCAGHRMIYGLGAVLLPVFIQLRRYNGRRRSSHLCHSRLHWTSLVVSGLPAVSTVARTSHIGGFVPGAGMSRDDRNAGLLISRGADSTNRLKLLTANRADSA
jgi:hypothetical protein